MMTTRPSIFEVAAIFGFAIDLTKIAAFLIPSVYTHLSRSGVMSEILFVSAFMTLALAFLIVYPILRSIPIYEPERGTFDEQVKYVSLFWIYFFSIALVLFLTVFFVYREILNNLQEHYLLGT